MTQMFSRYAYIHTVCDGRGNKYGFKGKSVKPGYFPSAEEGRGYAVVDPLAELNEALGPFGLEFDQLPDCAKSLWEKRKSFTLVLGVGAESLSSNRIPAARWIENLQGHQQMVQSIQRNKIHVSHTSGSGLEQITGPLSLPEIYPILGAEAPRVIDIPPQLTDPSDGETVNTGAVEGIGVRLVGSEMCIRDSLYSARLTRVCDGH